MNKIVLILVLLLAGQALKAQKIDSIFFHLYTDSLKKGTHNYINVDGKLSNGNWLPLTAKEIKFSSSACTFSGNELLIPDDFAGEKITVKAVLRERPELWIEKTIWIKTIPNPESLPTKEEVMRESKKRRSK